MGIQIVSLLSEPHSGAQGGGHAQISWMPTAVKQEEGAREREEEEEDAASSLPEPKKRRRGSHKEVFPFCI